MTPTGGSDDKPHRTAKILATLGGAAAGPLAARPHDSQRGGILKSRLGLPRFAGPAVATHRDLLVKLAARHGLPTIYPFRFYMIGAGSCPMGLITSSHAPGVEAHGLRTE